MSVRSLERPGLLPARLLDKRPGWMRHRWWKDVVLLAVGYAIYTLIRNAAPTQRHRAITNAHDIGHLEMHLGIFLEHGINNWLAPHQIPSEIANYSYATLHFVVTIAVAVWVLWKFPRYARSLRIAWYSMNVVALFGFYFYPLAPPRLVGVDFVDTVVKYGIWFNKPGQEVSPDGASNQFAAMPSMHTGWSTWCAIVIFVLARRWWVKLLALSYPIYTIAVITGTANHYFLDAVGGWIALAIGFGVARIMTGHGPFTPDRSPPRDPVIPVPQPV